MATNEKPKLAGPTRPLGLPEIPQFHLPLAGAAPKGAVYAPRLYGTANVVFKVGEGKRRVEETRRVAFLLPIDPTVRAADWDAAAPTDLTPDKLLPAAPAKAEYLPLPPRAMQINTFTRWAKTFDRWLARTQRFVLPPKADDTEPVAIAPKRGGVRVELVAIAWELVQA